VPGFSGSAGLRRWASGCPALGLCRDTGLTQVSDIHD